MIVSALHCVMAYWTLDLAILNYALLLVFDDFPCALSVFFPSSRVYFAPFYVLHVSAVCLRTFGFVLCCVCIINRRHCK